MKTIAPGGVVANNDVFVEVTGAITDGTMGEAITVLNALDTSAVAIGEDVIFFVNDGTNGYLYLLTQVSTADTIAAQDLTLIGQVTGVTNVADGDFVAFSDPILLVSPPPSEIMKTDITVHVNSIQIQLFGWWRGFSLGLRLRELCQVGDSLHGKQLTINYN